MFWNKKKDKENDTTPVQTDSKDDDVQKDKPVHAMGDGDGVPQALKDKLAEIRGSKEPEYDVVEVDDDGNPIKNEDGTLRIVKDDEVSGGDADDSTGGSEDGTPEPEGDDGASEFEEVELDPRLETAGRTMGWSDEKIKLVAETDITILEDLANRLERSESHQRDKEEVDGTTDQAVDDTTLTKLKEKFGDDADVILSALTKSVEKKFADKFKEVEDFKTASKEEAEKRTLIQKFDIASHVFDKHAEQFKGLGVTDELPKDGKGGIVLDSPQMNERSKVFKVAEMFHSTQGGTFEAAMNEAMTWYAGSKGVEIAARKVVKDLNSRKKLFSPQPTKRKTMKVFKSTDDKAAHIVKEAKRKAGIE